MFIFLRSDAMTMLRMLVSLASDADAARADQENLVGQDMENDLHALSSLRSMCRLAAVSPSANTAVEVLRAQFGEVVGVSAQAA
jgi:hypothetical protein